MSILGLILAAAFFATPPAQSVRGIVVDGSSHLPVFGAVISAPNGKRLAVTDRAGNFRIEAPNVPAAFRVSAPHLATKTVALTGTRADMELGRINLWRSGRVSVGFIPVRTGEHMRWSIARAEPGGGPTDVTRRGTVPEGRPHFVIDDLEPAHYLLALQGGGPLQQYAIPLTLEAGADLSIPVTITPVMVDLVVTQGDHPLPSATVRLENLTLRWVGDVQCDEDGKASVELWQTGKFWLFTSSSGVPLDGHIQPLDDHGTGHIPLHVRLPAHIIRGHVIDSSTGTPLKDVNVGLETSNGVRTAHSDAAGDFQFEAVPEGRHIIRAYKKGYRSDQPSHVTVGSDDNDVEQTIRLDPQTGGRQVRVIDAGGTPVVAANTFFGFGASVQLLEATDTEGIVTVPQGTGVLFAVPQAGSFAFRTIGADDVDPITMTVPPGIGVFTIISESTRHEPIPYVLFVLRVNGTFLPPSVVSRLATTQRLPFRTDTDGRAQLTGLPFGLYEVWAVRTRDELETIFRGTGGAPDATVTVSAMPQNVILTFRPKG